MSIFLLHHLLFITLFFSN